MGHCGHDRLLGLGEEMGGRVGDRGGGHVTGSAGHGVLRVERHLYRFVT
jgi:hypothetical protein